MTVFPPWHFDRWTAVDDRVRGGASVSHLDPVKVGGHDHIAARFHGTLDIDTLGGAGFASQRYQFGPSPLHLPRHRYDGILLHLLPADPDGPGPSLQSQEKDPQRPTTYTLVLKSTLRVEPPREPRVPPAPEPASLSYEASFSPSSDSASILESQLGAGAGDGNGNANKVRLGWTDFRPFYRGKEVKRDDPMWQPLRPEKIYELSFMCRSDFGKQKGEFGLVVVSLEGWEKESGFSGLFGPIGKLWEVVAGWMTDWAAWVASLWRRDEGHIRLEDKE